MMKMNNQPQTNILDTPVPNIGVETLRPTPFTRIVKSLRKSAVKVADVAKRKWSKFYNWIINYVPPPKRINPSSTIEKLKNHIKKLYRRSPDFESEERKRAARGYFKTYTITGRDYKDPKLIKLYLTDVQQTVTRVIENNLSQGFKVRLGLKCEIITVSPNAEGEYITATTYLNSNLKVILRKDTISEEYRAMIDEIFEKKNSKLS